MLTHKNFNKIAILIIVVILAAVLVLFFWKGKDNVLSTATQEPDYVTSLFDTDFVHTIDITMDDWEGFLEGCEDEQYEMCKVSIDGGAATEVAIRAKGNTSLSSVRQYGNNRYSFKLEFDQYQDGVTYDGLDKLSLNNVIQDNTYMKDYVCYQLMNNFGVDAPLCSYTYITVNGEDWGLYLAVEGVEDSFMDRIYGTGSDGNLYKPDSMSMGGGGPGVGKDFELPSDFNMENMEMPEGMQLPEGMEMPENMQLPEGMEIPEDFDPANMPQFNGEGGGFGGMGSDDTKLIYTDDDFDSYSNIFNNAKTNPSDEDKSRLIASLKKMNAGEELENVLDVDEVIRYFVVHNFVCNFDSYTGSMIHNYYLYEEDGKMSMIPWDYNLAFGGFSDAGGATSLVNFPIDTPVSGGDVSDRPMLAWIFSNEEYTELYHQYFDEFITEIFESGAFQEEFERVSAMIDPYVEKDPTKFCTYEEFLKGNATLESFCLLRAQSVRGQLDGTIPSTSEGQKADSSTLIDGSSLTISDMGGMGKGMGGPGGGGDFDKAKPGANGQSQADADGQSQPDAANTAQPAANNTQTGQSPPGQTGDQAPPAGMTGATPQSDSQAAPTTTDRPAPSGTERQSGKQGGPPPTEPTAGNEEERAAPSTSSAGVESPPGGGTQEEAPSKDSDHPSLSSDGANIPGGKADTSVYLLPLAVSVGVLLLGLVIAWRFRR